MNLPKNYILNFLIPSSKLTFWLLFCLGGICIASCQEKGSLGQSQKILDKDSIYFYGRQSYGGTGKYFLNREIAEVMGYRGANWLERAEREKEENVSLALKNFEIQENFTIADIGAGSGYYTFRVAQMVPKGEVFAVDIQPEMLQLIRKKIEEENVDNVRPVLASEKSPKLLENSLDLAFFVDVYHELSYPYEVLQQLQKALKPGGRVILLEYRAEDPQVPIKKLHKMTAKQAIKELEFMGFSFVENKKILPWQHLLVFEKP